MKLPCKLLLFALSLPILSACTSSDYRRDADDETYAAIAGKADLVPGMSSQIAVDEENQVELSPFRENIDSYEFLD